MMTQLQSVRECLPEIEAGIKEGTVYEVWEACREGGYPGTFNAFKSELQKARKEKRG